MLNAGVPVCLHTNEVNSGHGPSTIRALHLGLATNPDVVVAVDGDGQFLGADVQRVLAELLEPGTKVAEGVRTSRTDPFYRRGVSWTTRLLVWTRARRLPADANTPLRAYRPETLRQLLAVIPPAAATPNLLTSAVCRRWGVGLREVPVASIPRRGSSAIGTTWGAGRKSVPSRRFVAFCLAATREWVTTPIVHRSPGSAG